MSSRVFSSRTFHRLIAKIGIAALLFAQFTIAAYACSALTGSDNDMPAATANDMQTAMPGCEQLDVSNPNLCLQHCQAGSQSVQTAVQISIPPAAMMLLTVIEPVQPYPSLDITTQSASPEQETSPPPLIRFGVLRI